MRLTFAWYFLIPMILTLLNGAMQVSSVAALGFRVSAYGRRGS